MIFVIRVNSQGSTSFVDLNLALYHWFPKRSCGSLRPEGNSGIRWFPWRFSLVFFVLWKTIKENYFACPKCCVSCKLEEANENEFLSEQVLTRRKEMGYHKRKTEKRSYHLWLKFQKKKKKGKKVKKGNWNWTVSVRRAVRRRRVCVGEELTAFFNLSVIFSLMARWSLKSTLKL